MPSLESDIFKGLGVEVELPDRQSFLIIVETLTRMGVPSKRGKTLFQSAHLLHKKGRYAIMHFKEMFALDGKPLRTTDEDIQRRNTITSLLDEWRLLRVLYPGDIKDRSPMSSLKVIPHKEKAEWTLVEKYTVGRKRS